MATCRDIITYALRQTKVIASGVEPDASESSDGLVALQSLYDSWVANGIFGRLVDVYLEENDTAQEGRRYLLAAGITLTTPATIPDADDQDGDERQPRDLAIFESLTSTGTRTVKIYDRTEWVNLLGLGLSDTAPLSKRGAFGLAACLAVSGGFAAMFGSAADIGPDIRRLAGLFEGGIANKAGSTRDRVTAEYF